jgi:hypothetical protein
VAAAAAAGTYSSSVTAISSPASNATLPTTANVSSSTPTITVTPTSLNAFSNTQGIASASQAWTVQLANGTADVTVHNLAGFETSTDNVTFSTADKVLTHSGTTLIGQPVSMYTRVAAATAIGSYSGNITHTSTGASTVNVAVSANVVSGTNGFYRSITVDHTKVPNTNQTNFPVLFAGTYTYLKSVGNGGKVQNASGFDIEFCADNACVTKLNWEIESWNAATGAIVAWIQVPTLTTGSDFVYYLNYGNVAITTDQSNITGTWSNGFTQVQHFNETLTAAGQTLHDRTSTANNATSAGSWSGTQQTTGLYGPTLQFLNASTDYATMASTISLSSTYTIEWIGAPIATSGALDQHWLVYGLASAGGINWNFFSAKARLNNVNSSPNDQIIDNTSSTLGTYTYIAFTRTGTSAIAYHDGTQSATSSTGGNQSMDAFGANGGVNTYNINNEEFRISNVVRSPDWIATTQNTTKSPSTFYTVGSEVAH